jgi:hypothetical protein
MAAEAAAPIIFMLLFVMLWLIAFAIGILSVVFWIFMLVDAIQRKYDTENEKVTWIIVIVLTGIIGALIYYFMVKKKA